MIVSVPLSIEIGKRKKKRFYLNLNTYRNAYFHQLNAAKVIFKELVTHKIQHLPFFRNIQLTYTLYPKTRRKCDVANICSVVDKFFSDALVEAGKLEDDNYDFLPRVVYQFGAIDKDNPRVDVEIESVYSIENTIPVLETNNMKILATHNEIKQAIANFVGAEELEGTTVDIAMEGTEFVAVIQIPDLPGLPSLTASSPTPPEAETAISEPIETLQVVTEPEAVEEAPVETTVTELVVPEPTSNISSGVKDRADPEVAEKAAPESPKVETVAEAPVEAKPTTSLFGKRSEPFSDGEAPVEETLEAPVEKAPQPTQDEKPKPKPIFNFQKS